ncbi:coiled-coil-helix-coiled-coil-helix domain-containing protein 7 isoform X1 [Sander vitreus]
MDKKAGNVRNQDINPCIEESDASQKCLNAYNYDKSMCSAYFQRYKSCRKYWAEITLMMSLFFSDWTKVFQSHRRHDACMGNRPWHAQHHAAEEKRRREARHAHRCREAGDARHRRGQTILRVSRVTLSHWEDILLMPRTDLSSGSGRVGVTIWNGSFLK